MRNLRLLLTLLATICLLALGAYALANRPPQPPGDDIIIKGGSLEIQCVSGSNCLGPGVNGHYFHSKGGNHITKVVVQDKDGGVLFDSSDPNCCGGKSLGAKPEIHITYKTP